MTDAPAATAPLLANRPGIRHGFFGRQGGVSTGIYGSLNCGPGSKDAPEAVRENRARVARRLGAAHLLSLYQVHGAEVIEVRETWDEATRPRCDAMVTDRPGLALGALAADCGPILFAEAEAGVIGAAHAGWRGALAGVADATVAAMERLGARRERIAAVLGPTIAQASYEVGAEFPAPFLAQDRDNARFFAPGARPGKFQFDLPGYIVCAARTPRPRRGLARPRHLQRPRHLFQLPPHHPRRRRRLRPQRLGDRAGGVMLHFSRAELAERRGRTCAALAARGLDGLLCFRQESMYYLTGYDTLRLRLFPVPLSRRPTGGMILLTRAPDLRQAQLHLDDRGHPHLGRPRRRHAGTGAAARHPRRAGLPRQAARASNGTPTA